VVVHKSPLPFANEILFSQLKLIFWRIEISFVLEAEQHFQTAMAQFTADTSKPATVKVILKVILH
jgi:hypothetical protein